MDRIAHLNSKLGALSAAAAFSLVAVLAALTPTLADQPQRQWQNQGGYQHQWEGDARPGRSVGEDRGGHGNRHQGRYAVRNQGWHVSWRQKDYGNRYRGGRRDSGRDHRDDRAWGHDGR